MTNAQPIVLDSDEIRSLLDSFPDPAFLLDRNHRILGVNRAYRLVFADGEAVLGRHCYEVLHHEPAPCEPASQDCPLRDLSRRQVSARCLHVHYGPDCEQHHDVRVYPIRRRDGVAVGFLQTVRVLTAASPLPHPSRLVGRSPAFNRMLDLIRSAATSESPVLFQGEPGTGKRHAARAVHGLSSRRQGPLAIIDCATLGKLAVETQEPEGQAGPVANHRARWTEGLAAARGGTLVLNEPGDLPVPFQSELFQLLEHGFCRHGEHPDWSGANVRLICTSSRDLRSLTTSAALRADLYSRISIFPILVPSLRERAEDIPLLIDSLLQRIDGDLRQELSSEVLAMLSAYKFPGNIRELLGILERACLLAEGDTILPEHLQDAWSTSPELSSLPAGEELLPLDEVERRYLEWAVRNFQGDKATLARRLGVAERTLYRKLHELRAKGSE